MRIGTIGLAALAVLAQVACKRELILPGDRYDVRAPLQESLTKDEKAGAATLLTTVDAGTPPNRSVPVRLGPARSVADWPQRSLNATHELPNLALSPAPAAIWAVQIGQGNDKRHRLTADPIVAGGRVFTLDSRALVSAVSTAGQLMWQTDLTPPSDSHGDASGGGLAVGAGRLFVTTGFGAVSALDPATGKVLWQQKIGAVGNAAPTVYGDTLYVMGRDNSAWAIRADTGKVIWEVNGTPVTSAYVGGAGAAVDGRIAVLPFASGELIAVLAKSGVQSWTDQILGRRRGEAYASVSGISGDPVLVGNTLYVGNSAGRVVAMDAGRGERKWTSTEGTMGPVLVAGGSLFLVSDNAEVVRLNAETGERIWGAPLPDYVNPKPRKRQAAYVHYGPLLAGGRVLVASSDGRIRFFDPASGAAAGEVGMPGAAASDPVIAGGTLYIITDGGKLVAFR